VLNSKIVAILGWFSLASAKCFLAEPLSGSLIRQCADGQDLDSHVALEVLIVGAVQKTHATCTDLLDDAIVAERVADELGRSGHRPREC